MKIRKFEAIVDPEDENWMGVSPVMDLPPTPDLPPRNWLNNPFDHHDGLIPQRNCGWYRRQN